MNSFNHYALGAVGDWLHRTVAGLAPSAPGYRAIRVDIQPAGSLQWARAEHMTPYGLASSAWRIDGDALIADVVVPPNTLTRALTFKAGLDPVTETDETVVITLGAPANALLGEPAQKLPTGPRWAG